MLSIPDFFLVWMFLFTRTGKGAASLTASPLFRQFERLTGGSVYRQKLKERENNKEVNGVSVPAPSSNGNKVNGTLVLGVLKNQG